MGRMGSEQTPRDMAKKKLSVSVQGEVKLGEEQDRKMAGGT